MTDKHLADSQLDAAIDRAVRDLMSGEPRADLRRRVLAEITRGPVRASLWPRFAFASAAVALLVAFVLMSGRGPADRVPEEARATAPPSAISAPGRPSDASRPAAAPGIPPTATTRTGVPTRERRVASARPVLPAIVDRPIQAASIDAIEAFEIEASDTAGRLAPIVPLGLSRLDAPGAEVITPIRIERIEITPLAPPR